jgi:hypothetical protein
MHCNLEDSTEKMERESRLMNIVFSIHLHRQQVVQYAYEQQHANYPRRGVQRLQAEWSRFRDENPAAQALLSANHDHSAQSPLLLSRLLVGSRTCFG